MHPILFDIGGFQIHSYGALGALGFLFTAATAIIRGRKLGIDQNHMADLMFWTALIALVGARVVFVVQNPGVVPEVSDWVNLRTGGLVFYGSLLFGVPAGSAIILRKKMPFFSTWDIFGAAFPIAHGLSRIGCFLAGCCYGAPYEGPGSVVFTDPMSVAPRHTPMHATQLYEAGILFGIGIIVNLVYWKKKWNGQVMLVYLLLYAVGRSIVEEFRGDASRGFFFPQVFGELLTYSQGISILMGVFAIVVFGVIARRVEPRGA